MKILDFCIEIIYICGHNVNQKICFMENYIKNNISIANLKKGIYIVTYTNELKEKVGFEKLTIN